MDKKFLGIVAALLGISCIILLWISYLPQDEKGVTASSTEAPYVERFFHTDQVIDIYVTINESDFEDMMKNPAQEEYKAAAVDVDGVKVSNVGFRVKGNSSLNSVVRSDSQRYSFKVDFDQYINGQSLEGLMKLNLNNSFSDPSTMREYLSYSLLSEMGIPTPAFTYANVYINGDLIGLYLAIEGLEESFVARYYGRSDGTLYKPESEHGKGADLVYADDKISSYSGIKAVTELKNGSEKALIDMIKALHEGKELEEHLNVDEILRYFAVNTVLVNMDSYLGQFTHNYYLYEEDGIFSILPWDYNMSFGGFGARGAGEQSQTGLDIDQPVTGTTLDQRPLLGKLLEVDEYQTLYHQFIEEFINGPFSLEEMTAEIEEVADMIRPFLEKDPTKFYSMEQFERAISDGNQNGIQPGGNMMSGNSTGLVTFIRERIENVSKQLSGEISSTGGRIQPEGINRPPELMKGKGRGFEPAPFGDRGNIRNGNSGQGGNRQEIYVMGGMIVILIAAILIARKLRTKYHV